MAMGAATIVPEFGWVDCLITGILSGILDSIKFIYWRKIFKAASQVRGKKILQSLSMATFLLSLLLEIDQ